MSTHDEAVEAAIRDALVEVLDVAGFSHERFAELKRDVEPLFRAFEKAYLRHMRAAGFVVTRVPDARSPDGSTAERYALDISWNACRAEMLANAVEVPE